MNPLALVSDKPVSFQVEREGYGNWYAFVEVEQTQGGEVVQYTIRYHEKNCRALYKLGTRVLKAVSYEAFQCGVILHEVSHILGGTMLVKPLFANEALKYIWNTLLDSHDEWQLGRTYPAYSPYIRIALAALREQPPARNKTTLQRYLGVLYDFVRFGVIRETGDPAWINFMMRCVLPAIRGSAEDVRTATYALYYYLVETIGAERMASEMTPQSDPVPCADDELEELATFPQYATSSVLDAIKDVLEGNDPLGAGREHAVFEEDNADAFYRATTAQYSHIIAGIAQRFEPYVNRKSYVAAYEGEMCLAPDAQMLAYMASFSGEDVKAFKHKRIKTLEGKVAVLADVSFSTDAVKVPYAQARVIFLAAFERLISVEKALVLFNGTAHEISKFGDDLSTKGLKPQADGGTCLVPALNKTQAYNWGDGFRIQFAITDGDIEDWETAKEMLMAMQEQGILTFLVEIVESYTGRFRQDYKHAFQSTLLDLPERLALYTLAVMERHYQLQEA